MYAKEEEVTVKIYFVQRNELQQTKALLNQKGFYEMLSKECSVKAFTSYEAIAVISDIELLVEDVMLV